MYFCTAQPKPKLGRALLPSRQTNEHPEVLSCLPLLIITNRRCIKSYISLLHYGDCDVLRIDKEYVTMIVFINVNILSVMDTSH